MVPGSFRLGLLGLGGMVLGLFLYLFSRGFFVLYYYFCLAESLCALLFVTDLLHGTAALNRSLAG